MTTPVSRLWLWQVCVAAYFVCLLVAPRAAKGLPLVSVILLARSFLFAPLLLPMKTSEPTDSTAAAHNYGMNRNALLMARDCACMTVIAYLSNTVWNHGPAPVTLALREHPAVTTLGYDFILSCVSYALWYYSGSVRAATVAAADHSE